MGDYNWTAAEKRPLSPLACRVLFVLWQKKRRQDGSTARIDEIRDLVSAEFGIGPHESSRNSVKKVLNDMRRYGVVEFVMMRYGKVGAPSATFRVMPGAVVTRPATAAIVLKIYNHPHEPVPEEAFISEVQRMGLDDGEPLSSERVREEIEFAIRRGYIERIDDQPVRLGKGPRVDYERGFLELLVQTLRVFPTQTDSPSSKKQKLG